MRKGEIKMALNAHEEGFLRRLIRESPMPLPPTPVQPLQGGSLEPIVERELAKGKRGPLSLEDDLEFRRRVEHTMRKGEKLGQWISRTLISRAEAFRLSKDELAMRVKLTDEHNEAEGPHEPRRPASPFVPVDEVSPQNRSRFLVVG
jgi:hypothetical protein